MRFVDAGTRMRGVLLLVVWTCGPIRGSSSSLSPWSPRPTAPSPHGDLTARVRGGGGRRGRPPLYDPLTADVGLSRLTRHDRENNKPRVGRPPGRPPAWQSAQSNHRGAIEDGKLRGDFRTHSWGESAVGAIGECTAEQVLWEKYFVELQEHFNRTRAGLPDNWRDTPVLFRKGNAPPAKGLPLREWVDNQRQLYRHGELDVKRQQMLQDTGLQLTLKGKLREVDWETMVGRLKSFYMLHGHCRVHEHEGEELLEQWVQVQQMKEMRGTLGNEKQTLLNSLGVSWKSSWLESWKQLCLLKQHNGKIRVITLKTSKRTLPLYIWLRNQRLMQMEGSLDKDREELLDSLGCRWGGLEHGDSRALLGSSSLDRYIVWEPRFNCLLLFKQMQGHCDMQSFLLNNHETPESGATPPATLESADGNWTLKGPGRPPKKHREMLMRNLKSMEESCWSSGRVASSDFPLVAIWLQEQKMRLDRNRLESAHKDRLVALGAIQDHGANYAPGEGSKSLQTEWLQRLEELRQFKRATGHCSVPMKFPSNPGLARWVHTQRMRRRMGKMSAGRARQLEKLGFVFEGRSQWEQRFLELVRFKDRVGHCSPCQIGPNRRLGVWVAVQRVKYRKVRNLGIRSALVSSRLCLLAFQPVRLVPGSQPLDVCLLCLITQPFSPSHVSVFPPFFSLLPVRSVPRMAAAMAGHASSLNVDYRCKGPGPPGQDPCWLCACAELNTCIYVPTGPTAREPHQEARIDRIQLGVAHGLGLADAAAARVQGQVRPLQRAATDQNERQRACWHLLPGYVGHNAANEATVGPLV